MRTSPNPQLNARGATVLEPRSHDRALDLPPLFRAIALREGGDAFARACAIAADAGAGALVHVGSRRLVEFALVLEPEQPFARARGALYVGMLALARTLAALAPPEKPIAIRWPDTLIVDGGVVGGGRLGWAGGSAESEIPPWLVFGAMIRLGFPPGVEPGRHPMVTALAEEGFGAPSGARLVEGFARHFMMLADAWQQEGFDVIAHGYLEQIERSAALRYTLAENGDLLIARERRAAERRSLHTALPQPSWLALETGEPRL